MNMAKSGNQTQLGKAFEYACVNALYEKYKDTQDVIVEDSPQMRTAKGCFENSDEKKNDFIDAAKAAVRVINRLEPRLEYPDNDTPLVLSI